MNKYSLLFRSMILLLVLPVLALSFSAYAAKGGNGKKPKDDGGESSLVVFVPVGSMAVTRAMHTATKLLDGRVLVAGGIDRPDTITVSETSHASAEIYDPVLKTFSSVGSMNFPRSSHTATLLQDGRVLVIGGGNNVNGSFVQLDSVEIFDTASNSWSIVANKMTMVRMLHSATLLLNGDVLITGGFGISLFYGSGTDSAEIFHTNSMTFSALPPMNLSRSRHGAVLLSSGNVLIMGGERDGTWTRSVEVYDVNTQSFSTSNSMNQAHRYGSVVGTNVTGNALITGQATGYNQQDLNAETFDSNTGSFTQTGDMTIARQKHSSTLSADGMFVLIVGGENIYVDSDQFAHTTPLKSVERYDLQNGTFSLVGDMSTVRYRHSATLLDDGSFLVVGGFLPIAGTPTLSSAEVYQP